MDKYAKRKVKQQTQRMGEQGISQKEESIQDRPIAQTTETSIIN